MFENLEEALKIFKDFGIEKIYSFEKYGDGIINRTFLMEADHENEKRKFIAQIINPLFDIETVMKNVEICQNHIAGKIGKNEKVLHAIKTTDGKNYARNRDDCWRIYDYIENSYTLNQITEPRLAGEVGKAFGRFHTQISDIQKEIANPLPGFHDTEKYYQEFKKAIQNNPKKRFEKEEISDWLLSKESDTQILSELVSEGKIPLRVTHNDPKLNNVLFEKKTGKVLAIVDWDTISKHLPVLVDWGDMCRSGCSSADETEKDLTKVVFRLDYFEEMVKNYLKTAREFLNQTEKEYLYYAIEHITFELTLRFYTDYINGDTYFSVRQPKDNYRRAMNQFALWKSIKNKEQEIKEIINNYL